jgi:hypothetical protein
VLTPEHLAVAQPAGLVQTEAVVVEPMCPAAVACFGQVRAAPVVVPHSSQVDLIFYCSHPSIQQSGQLEPSRRMNEKFSWRSS